VRGDEKIVNFIQEMQLKDPELINLNGWLIITSISLDDGKKELNWRRDL
jgi:hypothetical protein